MEDSAHQLDEARRQGDPDVIAEALTIHANTLVESGEIDQAREALDEAALIHREQGRVYDEARCTHLAATLYRLGGNLDEAEVRAKHAARLAEPGSAIAVSAATELGEIARARGRGLEAANYYGQAFNYGESAGLIDSARASLLRRRASALAISGQFHEAAAELTLAYGLFMRADEIDDANRALVEKATALQQAGDYAVAEQALRDAMHVAEVTGDYHALSDLYLLKSAQFLEAKKDAEGAMAAAQTARTHALTAVAPISYIAAAVAIAELADAAGDRLAAYEALAVGWVTLSDLLGKEVGRATFAPKLMELQQRWGEAEFQAVKTAYEDRRRSEIAGNQSATSTSEETFT